jgi:hypothetical protein
MQIGQRSGTALPHQIECLHIRAQAEALDDMAGQPGAQVPRAGTHHHGIYLCRNQPCLHQRAFAGLCCQQRRVAQETLRKCVRIDHENLIE